MGRIIVVKHPWILKPLRKQGGSLVLASHFFSRINPITMFLIFLLMSLSHKSMIHN